MSLTQRQGVYRSEKYRRLVASLPCANCGAVGKSQAAHSNLLRHGKGKGIKATDAATFPLCHDKCHPWFDQGRELTKQERQSLTMDWIADTHIKLLELGHLEIAA